jgi:multiple RNA-binding domain-containing protein 1
MDGQHRGFAFVEYDSIEDARLAKEALGSTHLYGRKLVV